MTGEELRGRRARLGLSQAQLGVLLGVPANTISRWETGALPIEKSTMLDLALQRLEETTMSAPYTVVIVRGRAAEPRTHTNTAFDRQADAAALAERLAHELAERDGEYATVQVEQRGLPVAQYHIDTRDLGEAARP